MICDKCNQEKGDCNIICDEELNKPGCFVCTPCFLEMIDKGLHSLGDAVNEWSKFYSNIVPKKIKKPRKEVHSVFRKSKK